MEISDISRLGVVTISFFDTMIVPAEAKKVINETVLSLSLDLANLEMADLTDFTWQLIKFTDRKMTLYLNFNDPKFVS